MSIRSVLTEVLRVTERREYAIKVDVLEQGLWTKHYRSLSARFSGYANEPQNPTMQRQDRLIAEHFSDMADTKEKIVSTNRQRLAEIADRKTRLFALLDRAASLEEAEA